MIKIQTNKFRKIESIRTSKLLVLFMFSLSLLFFPSCGQKKKQDKEEVTTVLSDTTAMIDTVIPILEPIFLDSVSIVRFSNNHPQLRIYKEELDTIYKRRDYEFIWFNKKGILDIGDSLYNKIQNLQDEGVFVVFPYQKNIDRIFGKELKNIEKHPEYDLLFTALYLFYFDHVYKGLDISLADINWYLPRNEPCSINLLDSITVNKHFETTDSLILFNQYHRLRKALKHYRGIEENGGWSKIEGEELSFRPNDSSEVIQQIRERLFISGEIDSNNLSPIYDEALRLGIFKFQRHHGFNEDTIVSKEHIAALNIPVEEYIKKIIVNMERSRWLQANIYDVKEYIFVNIPAYRMTFVREGEVKLNSNVVVGTPRNKTVIFKGMMSYIAFSPFWNIPQSIVINEIIPGMEKDVNYLSKRNMEWRNNMYRQLPGKNNSLGLVKFMFPNQYSIYLHDSPAKSLFTKEFRARSHGCIRVKEARELALKILENNEKWPVERIDKAMNTNHESICSLEEKIPVHLAYFTAWVDEENNINFYPDVYERDEKVAKLLKVK